MREDTAHLIPSPTTKPPRSTKFGPQIMEKTKEMTSVNDNGSFARPSIKRSGLALRPL